VAFFFNSYYNEHEMDTNLVLLPGLDGTDVFLRPLVERLPARARPLVLTYPDAGPHDYRALFDLTYQALAGIPRCVLLASSFSGPLAVMLAAAEPCKVCGLILVATFASSPSRQLTQLRFAIRTPLVTVIRIGRRLPVWALRSPRDALRIAKRETWSRVSSRSLAARARTALGADVRETLKRCTQPVLCVSYDADEVVPSSCADDISRYCMHVRRVTLPGGHLAIFTDPGSLAAEITRFINVDCAPQPITPSGAAASA
jgi:pimeloyl-ACP methyl ester carboxylesterase